MYINCDMGEWDAFHLKNQDHLIMPHINLCNVACGGHAGSLDIMRQTIILAMENKVEVGAHPGYEDRSNFGRLYVEMTKQELKDLLRSQIDLFLEVVDHAGGAPNHIKPHGALYHACNHRELEMNILIETMRQEYSNLTLLVFPDSILHRRAKAEGMDIMSESFIDRMYTDDFKLASRNEKGATITEVNKAKIQFDNLVKGEVTSKNGTIHQLVTQTACIHGDNPFVLEILESIRP